MAREFDDASSERLEIDSTPVTAFPLTISSWIWKDDTEGDNVVWIGDKDVADQWLAELTMKGAVPGQQVRARSFDGTTGGADTSAQYSINTWHHICGVFTSNVSRAAFLDGGNKGTNATDVSPANADRISIGRYGDSTPGGYLDGKVAEVAIWNVALTDAEVAILAAGYSPLFVRPGSLVAYWPLVRGLNDKVGGYNLTASGTTVVAHPRIIYPAPPYIIEMPAAVAGVVNIDQIAAHIYRMRRLNNM